MACTTVEVVEEGRIVERGGVTVTPSKMNIGSRATASLTVENTGGSRASATVVLKVGGGVVDQTNVTLDPGRSRTVELGFVPQQSNPNLQVCMEVQ